MVLATEPLVKKLKKEYVRQPNNDRPTIFTVALNLENNNGQKTLSLFTLIRTVYMFITLGRVFNFFKTNIC